MLQTRRIGLVLATTGTLLLALSSVASAAWERGTNGDDTLTGTDSGDWLMGRAGDDTIYGEGGPDMLWGDRGDDVLVPGPGRDMVFGGPGNDTIDALDGQRDTIVCGPGFDTVSADPVDRVIGCEVVIYGPLPGQGDGGGQQPGDEGDPNDPDDV